MTIFINPGTGPVPGATEQHASVAVDAFLVELGEGFSRGSPGAALGGGRWAYEISHDGHTHEVDMPGLPVERVRWIGEESGSIFLFPRLYVDGSSWIWAFALNVLRGCDRDGGERE